MSRRPKVLMHRHGRPRPPRIIAWDLETAPNVVTAHSLFNDKGLPTSAIMREKYIICGSWKIVGEPRVYSACVSPRKPQDDKQTATEIHEALTTADAVVAHYGDAFDMRTFNARAIFHGLAPLPPVVQIDTYKIAKQKFKFNANRLDYLGHYLGLGRKISTNYALWDRCMRGDPRALRDMVKYNQRDVVLLEDVFVKLYPYSKFKLDIAALTVPKHDSRWGKCGHCGSEDMKHRGAQLCRTRYHDMYQCAGCGAWRTGPVVGRSKGK